MMNWDQIEQNWKQFKGIVKDKWGKRGDYQRDANQGKKERAVGKLQKRIVRKVAEKKRHDLGKNAKSP